MADFGDEEGERCWRNGCAGTITLRDIDGDCSCHINPPCGHCTTPREACYTCGWNAEDEQNAEYLNGFRGLKTGKKLGGYDVVNTWVRRPLDPRKIDYHVISTNTGCTQKCEGVYPPGTTATEVWALVKGTFGGRFERFGDGHFTYVAYTD